jgi:hypothetical protein
MATSTELLVAVEALLDELEEDLRLPVGVNVAVSPLPTLKQMMSVLEPRLRAIAVAVPPGAHSSSPSADMSVVLAKLDELLARVTPPPVVRPPESADGTESPPAPVIVDATGRVWDLVRPYDLIVYQGGRVHLHDGLGWVVWVDDGSALGGSWVPSRDPRGSQVPPPPPPSPPPQNQAPRFELQPGGANFTQGVPARVSVPYRASDPDGDPLFARVVGELPAGVTVTAVSSAAVELEYDGRDLGATATKPVTQDVTLEVSDGRG